MKLHLGCGRKKWEGFTNIDLADADINCDIRELPFDDGCVDEIHAIHVCEHFFITEILQVLREWNRVLRVGGSLFVELPCWDKVQVHIANHEPENMTRWALYGDPKTHVDGVPALHKYCYSKAEFAGIMKGAGFIQIEHQVPVFHVPSRDMRLVARK